MPKLANPVAGSGRRNAPEQPFNNGKKRRRSDSARSVHPRDASRAELAETGRSSPTGTVAAVKGKGLSAATTGPPPAPDATKIGRNRRGRRSTGLRKGEVENIIAAAVFTAREQRPLNRHTTIHFEAAGIADPVRAIGQYLKLAGDWLRTQGARFAYIWVRESGATKGEHVHILMHVPPKLAAKFAMRERSWRKRIGAKRAKGAFRSTPIGRSYRHAEVGVQFGESYADHLAEIVGYLVKGAEQKAVRTLGLERAEAGGELFGKRCGMSESVGRAARRRAGSVETPTSFPIIDVARLLL